MTEERTNPERTTPKGSVRQMPPRPQPAPPAASDEKANKIPRHEDPTRYGDWEIGGRCIDF